MTALAVAFHDEAGSDGQRQHGSTESRRARALARQAVASAPAGLASIGSGANNTARYLGAAIGVTIVAVLAGHPTPAGVISGWNVAVLVTAAISLAGALTVALFGRRASTRQALAAPVDPGQRGPQPRKPARRG